VGHAAFSRAVQWLDFNIVIFRAVKLAAREKLLEGFADETEVKEYTVKETDTQFFSSFWFSKRDQVNITWVDQDNRFNERHCEIETVLDRTARAYMADVQCGGDEQRGLLTAS